MKKLVERRASPSEAFKKEVAGCLACQAYFLGKLMNTFTIGIICHRISEG